MNLFNLGHAVSRSPNRNAFFLHDHESYEIFWFLDGDVNYIVEGNISVLKPYEMVIIPPHVMHRTVQKSSSRYERVILDITEEFFERYQCPQYKKALRRANPKIDADQIFSSGLSQLLERLKKYTHQFTDYPDSIMLAMALEILHILSEIDDVKPPEEAENTIQKIILYINQHYMEKFSLDDLAESVYLSKEHMCRSFKKATGYTVISYLNHIRINCVKELHKGGMTFSEASMKAGFGSYVHFYKAFCKENGIPPRELLE